MIMFQSQQFIHNLLQRVLIHAFLIPVKHFVHLLDLFIKFRLRHNVRHDDLKLLKVDFLVLTVFLVVH